MARRWQLLGGSSRGGMSLGCWAVLGRTRLSTWPRAPIEAVPPRANDAHFWLALAFHLLLHHPRWCLGLAAAHTPALPAAKSHRCWIEGKGEAEETPVAQAPKSGAGAAGLSHRAAEVQFCNPGLGRPLWWCARERKFGPEEDKKEKHLRRKQEAGKSRGSARVLLSFAALTDSFQGKLVRGVEGTPLPITAGGCHLL